MDDVTITGDGIRLGQLLKLANLIDSGSDAKLLLATDAVVVNGDVETRRGRQLVVGDVVTVGETSVRVSSSENNSRLPTNDPRSGRIRG